MIDHDHEVLELMQSIGTDDEKFAAEEYIAACDDERAVLRKCPVWKKFAELAAAHHEGTRASRLRRAGQGHALYLALCAVLMVCAVIGVLAAHQNQCGAWLAICALAAVLALLGAIHHASEVYRHADLLATEIAHHKSHHTGWHREYEHGP